MNNFVYNEDNPNKVINLSLVTHITKPMVGLPSIYFYSNKSYYNDNHSGYTMWEFKSKEEADAIYQKLLDLVQVTKL